MKNLPQTKTCKSSDMVTYSFGECANSLATNFLYGFAMLYYTKALGLTPKHAGLALFISILWDAISDPIMGHISDNTRSRYGRRYPYLVLGGLTMVISFFFLWYIPGYFKSTTTLLFWYLVFMNLALRTAYTIFNIPYTAMGFEICTDYLGRAKLQGIKLAMNMAANLAGPALSWTIFFSSNNKESRATQNPENYLNMGVVFTAAILIFVLAVVYFTAKYIRDSREDKIEGNTLTDFLRDMLEIITDSYGRLVFGYIFMVFIGAGLAASLQMYVYEDFMVLEGWQKSVTHGGSMVAMGLGSLISSFFVRKIDKKGAACVGVIWSLCSNIILAVIFLPGLLKPGQMIGNFPISFVIFTLFHAGYWFGNGIMLPVAISMMADISEINQIKTGYNKDGGYSAVFSFALKTAMSIGTLISGYTLFFIGYEAGIEATQTPRTLWYLCAATLLMGPVISVLSLVLMVKYPVNKILLESIRKNNSSQAVE